MTHTVLQHNTKRALLVDEKSLRRLNEIISKAAPCRLEVRLRDGLVKQGQTIDNVIALPNSTAERMESLKWEGSAEDIRIVLTIQDFHAGANISYEISGQDELTIRDIRTQIDVWIKENGALYGIFAHANATLALGAIVFLGILITLGWGHLAGPDLEPEAGGPIPPGATLLAILVVTSPLWLGIPIDNLRMRLFPMLEITTCYGQNRYRRLMIFRSGILLTIILGLAVNLMTSWL